MGGTTLTAALISPRGLAVTHWRSGEVSLTEEGGRTGGPQPVWWRMVQVDIGTLQRGKGGRWGRKEEGGSGKNRGVKDRRG